jgi:hypothetical protein
VTNPRDVQKNVYKPFPKIGENKAEKALQFRKIVLRPRTPREERQSVGGGWDGGMLLPRRARVTPLAKTMGEDGNT